MSFAIDLRVGMIGAGMVSRHHLEAWAEIPRARVVGIADPDVARATARAKEFSIDAVFDDAADLMASGIIDAADIAAPVEFHAGLCRMAARNGLAILCQKPLCPSVDEAVRLIDDLGSSVLIMVHENWRHRPHYRVVHGWLAHRYIGRIEDVHMTVRSRGLVTDENGRFPALERQPLLANLPRFLVFEVLIHHLDVLSWLLGPLRVVKAKLGSHSGAIRGEDRADILLHTDDGVSVHLSADYADPSAEGHVQDTLTLVGSAGIVRVRDAECEIAGSINEHRRWSFDDLYRASYNGAIQQFADGVVGRTSFETTPSQHLEVLRLMESVYNVAGRMSSSPGG